MSKSIADWWKWQFESDIEDRDEVGGCYHDYALGDPDHVKVHEFFERDVWSLRPGRQHATDVSVARLRAETMNKAARFCEKGEGQ